MYLLYFPRVKDQGETKEEPRNDQRTPNYPKVLFIKIAFSFPSLILCLIPPTDDRENSKRRAHQLPAYKKCCFLRLLPKTVDCLPKTVDCPPKKVDSIPKKIYSLLLIFYCVLHSINTKNALFRKKSAFFFTN